MLATIFACALLVRPALSLSQEKDEKGGEKKAEQSADTAEKPKEEISVTEHTIKVGGQTIPYKATAQTILLKDDKGAPIALIYSTAYTRSDVKDPSTRPLSFLYNGGPGSSSVWLHMGSFGPRRVATVNAGITPPAPYKLLDNPECLLDRSDLVFIDPVGTASARPLAKRKTRILGHRLRRKIARAIHQDLHHAQQSLELAEIPDRRKLRHVSQRRAHKLSAEQ